MASRRRLLWVAVVVAGALAVLVPVETWALAGTGEQHTAEVRSHSLSHLPSDTPVSASPSPSLPKGTCTESQLTVGKVTSLTELAPLGMQRLFPIIRLQNSGEACTFQFPKLLEVASDTGPYRAVDVDLPRNGGVPFHVPAGRSYIAISEMWPMPSQPSLCSDPITDVTRVRIPLAAGTIQVHLPAAWVSVCASPSTTAIMEYHPVPGTDF